MLLNKIVLNKMTLHTYLISQMKHVVMSTKQTVKTVAPPPEIVKKITKPPISAHCKCMEIFKSDCIFFHSYIPVVPAAG
ncbi:MAG: hypothetical protein EA364_00800 [Balneolaceae bacterium]|nr:MAG: hypothetical protein EA364_00800 [Balneolaceae bacterium]